MHLFTLPHQGVAMHTKLIGVTDALIPPHQGVAMHTKLTGVTDALILLPPPSPRCCHAYKAYWSDICPYPPSSLTKMLPCIQSLLVWQMPLSPLLPHHAYKAYWCDMPLSSLTKELSCIQNLLVWQMPPSSLTKVLPCIQSLLVWQMPSSLTKVLQ